MAHIARLAGVHVSTVSRALGDSPLVEKSMRDRILKIAHQHGYVANSTARNLRAGRTQTLSVVIPLAHERGQDLTDPFFAYMLSHLADEITQRGYGMHLKKVLPPMQGWMQRMVLPSWLTQFWKVFPFRYGEICWRLILMGRGK